MCSRKRSNTHKKNQNAAPNIAPTRRNLNNIDAPVLNVFLILPAPAGSFSARIKNANYCFFLGVFPFKIIVFTSLLKVGFSPIMN